ncbi:entericidin A/B family lipoprotein [Pantoea sp. Z09]|nr:entericidin A/B family lipoprotein [Pantoea sp. Z09]
MKKQLTLFTLVLLACCALNACNTFHGFGEDVSHLGGAISRAAK